MTFVAKHPNAKRPHRRSQRVKTVSMLPSLFTLGNLLCGFAAIYFAMRATLDFGAGVEASEALTFSSVRMERLLPSFLSVGAGLVLLGMLFDMIDGALARITKHTSSFGGQLDSLADMVTSGAAPATLMLAFMMNELRQRHGISLSPISEHLFGRFAWVSAAVYVACAAVRLARFNVEHAKDDFDHSTFRGLPSPGAAGVMVALLIFVEQTRELGWVLPARLVLSIMPLVALGAGLLMVSPIPYLKITSAVRGRRPYRQLIIFIFLFATIWVAKAPALLVLALCYALSGPVVFLLDKTKSRRGTAAPTEDEAIDEDQSRQTG